MIGNRHIHNIFLQMVQGYPQINNVNEDTEKYYHHLRY